MTEVCIADRELINQVVDVRMIMVVKATHNRIVEVVEKAVVLDRDIETLVLDRFFIGE